MKILIILLACLVLAGCQTYTRTRYYKELGPDGKQLIEETEKHTGLPNWSDGKTINISGAKL